ncbi:MAG: CRISPR-associated protein Csm4 [Candidatus Atribacteria bacterium]|nr:CRISPR-associated protein Csm4 [Candidatus Atribacteria bacterium]
MKCQVIKLFSRETVRLHPGAGRMDRTETIVHADTLFSAICNALVKLYGEESLSSFMNEVLLSSLFPALRKRETETDLLFLPRPIASVAQSETTLLSQRKKEKKVGWLSWQAFAKLISTFNSQNLSFDCSLLDETIFTIEGKFALLTEEKETLKNLKKFYFSNKVEPHVSTDRESGTARKEGGLYFQEDLVLSSGETTKPFLYFLVNYNQFETLLSPVLNLLIEEGIGGERHQGKGVFDWWEREEVEIENQGEYLILFSTTLPAKEEIKNLVYYELIPRRGFVYYHSPTTFYKKPIFKLGEGSIVRLPFRGCNVNVSWQKNYPVISYGKALGFAFS